MVFSIKEEVEFMRINIVSVDRICRPSMPRVV
jgi:hypothetical protein